MATVKLTKSVIDKAVYQGNGKNNCFVWCSQLKGFGVKIFPSGVKAFVVKYRHSGRQHVLTLGRFGILTVEQAREIAKDKLAEVSKGIEPIAERRKETAILTVAQLCDVYLEQHSKLHKKTFSEDARRFETNVKPKLGRTRINAVTRTDISRLHQQQSQTAPYEANRTLALLSSTFNFAIKMGYLKENPCNFVTKNKEVKRDRWLSPEELPKLIKAVNECGHDYAINAIWLYLLLGLRKTELLSLKWNDLDMESKQLRLADTKSGKPLYLPLTAPVIEVTKKISKTSSPYLFPSPRDANKPMQDFTTTWRNIKKVAGLEDVRLHDLRRTVGSWLAQSGNSLHLIGKVLNHSNASTTQVYARFGQDSVRTALEQHGTRLLNVVNGKVGEVIELKQKAG